MNIVSVCYVPPANRKHLYPDAFMANISAWKNKYPVILYSDDNWDGTNKIANPELVKDNRKPFAVNNCVFLFGLKMAMDAKADYMLYLESDIRVFGDHWDEVIVQDFDREGYKARETPPLIYGTPVEFNVSQGGGEVAKQFIRLAHDYLVETNCPPAIHGAWPGSPNHPLLFPNGALSIYSVPLLQEFFDGFDRDIGRYALSMAAFDHEIGVKFWRKFNDKMFDRFQFATKCYSGYGDSLMDYNARKNLIGQMVAIHQVKSSDTFVS